ncbi:hypothetical protein Moror_14888 [Moniliophthora roreri MCA 2997]|uniref:Uncharacterized protein n=1 Tax=Moniliophthora roreri (strain MCA 2997) TaxID=1381753 RepID=V2WLU6_MONRO|nr:hypothetical protein Moror_14888 [Moniliophthora roreri MCA 2997]KAI3621493.1 hypothetical protein WG66_009416 [Moniliophthora roreri]
MSLSTKYKFSKLYLPVIGGICTIVAALAAFRSNSPAVTVLTAFSGFVSIWAVISPLLNKLSIYRVVREVVRYGAGLAARVQRPVSDVEAGGHPEYELTARPSRTRSRLQITTMLPPPPGRIVRGDDELRSFLRYTSIYQGDSSSAPTDSARLDFGDVMNDFLTSPLPDDLYDEPGRPPLLVYTPPLLNSPSLPDTPLLDFTSPTTSPTMTHLNTPLLQDQGETLLDEPLFVDSSRQQQQQNDASLQLDNDSLLTLQRSDNYFPGLAISIRHPFSTAADPKSLPPPDPVSRGTRQGVAPSSDAPTQPRYHAKPLVTSHIDILVGDSDEVGELDELDELDGLMSLQRQ